MKIQQTSMDQHNLRRGKRIKLKPHRRFMSDYLYFTSQVPSQPVSRICDVQNVVQLRKKSPQRIGWAAIMLKAMARLAQSEPELSYAYIKWPWPHLYQHPHQIGYVAMNRIVDDENLLIFHRIERPEQCSLLEIQNAIEQAREQPLDENRLFRMRDRFSRLPWFFRRIIWWFALNLFARVRTNLTGTVGVTSLAQYDVTSIHPPTLGNLVVTYGPVQPDGTMQITFVYDHRVHDGVKIATCLQKFETILNDVICEELQSLSEARLPPLEKAIRMPFGQSGRTGQNGTPVSTNRKERQAKH